MKKQILLAVTLLFSATLLFPLLAVGQATVPVDPTAEQQLTPEEAAALAKIPPAQLELMKKREQAKKHRDEMMKLRQQNIDAMNMGAAPTTVAPQTTGN